MDNNFNNIVGIAKTMSNNI